MFKIDCKTAPGSLFQALSQWGRSKKRAQDERPGSGEKKNRRAREGPSFFLYQTPLVARRPAAFDKPH